MRAKSLRTLYDILVGDPERGEAGGSEAQMLEGSLNQRALGVLAKGKCNGGGFSVGNGWVRVGG